MRAGDRGEIRLCRSWRGIVTWVHVTMPLSTDGSAINNVIRELTNQAALRGIDSAVVGSHRRSYDFPDARLIEVDYTKYLPREYLARHETSIDAVAGRLGLARPFARRTYRPAAEVLRSVEGPIIVHEGHYGTTAPSLIRELGNRGDLFLYVHARPSRSYTGRELRRLVAPLTRVVCVSDAIREHIAARLQSQELGDRLVTVLNGVDTARFSPRVGPTTTDAPPKVLFVGSMTPNKGPDVLLSALEFVAPAGHRFRATFVGSFTHAPGLELSDFERELHARSATLGGSVEFTPFVPNDQVADLYRDADILVVPSQFDDPCPLVVLEGMASGLPVVATRRGGIPELGLEAIQYFDGPGELASVLDPLLEDVEVRHRWGERARARALDLSWASQFNELASVVSAR